MTCNSEWKEMKDKLEKGQRPQDRLDLTTRVFRGKLMDLKDQILKKEILGKVAAYYDKYVQAEIRDKETNMPLYEVVVKHMLHGPCEEYNKECPRLVNTTCRFRYPRPFSSKTMQGNDVYPIYRRMNDGNKVKVRNATLNNRWVVPSSPYLLLRYNCHINVEICSGLKAVKYIYKYIYKGHDRAAIYISHDDDSRTISEIREFQDAR
ncbi:uncharacterized protein LOC111388741 [Olea europaea var. sylvestris]|uniref:uncharacterized protein LOC111388741 n=1 Tax=Olea europaea var. sylvestris TaxID=158386 RepID=UPI000C1D630B|nr:uncharacterized protein LOC111388741 [Olea europaea var. sylvestris]